MSRMNADPEVVRADMRKMFSNAVDFRAAVHNAIGAGSVCWDDPSGAGEFRSDIALIIAEELCFHLQKTGVFPPVVRDPGGAPTPFEEALVVWLEATGKFDVQRRQW